ncbi:MAG: Tryptophan synthase beta chain 1 [Candidatus Bathyarchaeota archaeon BA1]|nr:MAG: Tryptophan synthase beta chain 1 [Candidatus Bathyarchaeota archaeon BA1]
MFPSPSNQTQFGKSLLEKDPNHPGTLGIAISECLEDTLSHEDTRYCLGSVLNHVLLHQTIVGQEAKMQFEMIDVYPDVFCDCIDGGSNFSGFCFPFMRDKLKGKSNSEFFACEARAVPTPQGAFTPMILVTPLRWPHREDAYPWAQVCLPTYSFWRTAIPWDGS